MKLKCRIRNKEYDFVQGNDFSDEFNETLDSSTIILSNVDKIEDLDILDDVYIYNANEKFGGFLNEKVIDYEEFEIKFISDIEDNSDDRWLKIYFLDFANILNNYNISKQKIIFNIINQYPYSDNMRVWQVEYKFKFIENKYYLVPKDNNFPTYEVFTLNEKDVYIICPMGKFNQPVNDVFFPYPDPSQTLIETAKVYYTQKINPLPKFFKHFLVGNFSEDTLNLRERKYKYKIELDSETKGLEVVQLPNISITQPLNFAKKVSTYQIAKNMVELYSPKIKMVVDYDKKEWKYVQKYHLDSSIEEIFGDSYSPDFTLNNPNLRDVLSQLFIVKDMIPYVKNNVIYAMDISARGKDFNFDVGRISYNIIGAKTGENYCDNLKRTYSNALSQDYSCRMVENLGFRNSTSSLMKISNMRLETRYPIYKINKVYMCYYKKGEIYKNGLATGTKKMFLCKQDITPLVKLNSERNLLSKDFDDFEKLDYRIDTIEEMAQYKIATIGYDIGSNIIDGWGANYTYLKSYGFGHWNKDRTYVENIVRFMDSVYPLGIYDKSFFNNELGPNEMIYFGEYGDDNNFFDNYINHFDNNSLGLKGLFFQIDYNPFYNGTVIHSKNNGKDRAMINDNSSSSLTLLEKDGLSQQEKVNRYGNKGITIHAIYKDISELQDVGSVINRDDIGEDFIVYKRDYSIFDNEIRCTYYATKDYVLKNYFTSVYAKHRPYNLMSYNESVRRSENRKISFLLSKDKLYYENIDNSLKFTHFDWSEGNINYHPYMRIFSFAKPSEKIVSTNYYPHRDKINCGYIKFNGDRYLSDINGFVSGHSLCFNLSMFDNVSGGVYIKTPTPEFDAVLPTDPTEKVEDDYSGSLQDWYILTDDIETGYIKELGFYICHLNAKEEYNDKLMAYNKNKIKHEVYNKLFNLPLVKYNFSNEDEEENYVGIQKIQISAKSFTWLDKSNNVIPTYVISFKNEDLSKLKEKTYIGISFNTVGYGTAIVRLEKSSYFINGIYPYIASVDKIIKDDNGNIIEIIMNAEYKLSLSISAWLDFPVWAWVHNDFKVDKKNVKMSFKLGEYISYPGNSEVKFNDTDTTKNFYCKIENVEYDGKTYTYPTGIQGGWDYQDVILGMDKEYINKDNSDIYNEKNYYENAPEYLELDLTTFNEKIIGNNFILNKDNKEVIDMTFQFEPYTNNYNDVLFSQWMMKLSDLIDTYNKVEEDYRIFSYESYNFRLDFNYTTSNSYGVLVPIVVCSISNEMFEKMNVGDLVKGTIEYAKSIGSGGEVGRAHYYKLDFKKINDINVVDGWIELLATQTIVYTSITVGGMGVPKTYVDDVIIRLDLVTSSNNHYKLPLEANKKYFQKTIYEISFMFTNIKNETYQETITSSYFDFTTDKVLKDNQAITNKNSNLTYVYSVDEEGYTTTIEKNMFIRTSESKLKPHLTYDEYKKEDLVFTDLKVSQVFNVYSPKYGNNEVIIRVDLSLFENKNIKSIQYWYYDEISKSMKFVFGVNVNEEDWKKGQIMIYISALTNKNDVVYGQDNLEIGKVINYLDNDTNKRYGESQYYVENKE